MARIELVGSGKITITRTGRTGYRYYKCTWAERYTVAPLIGESFSIADPELRCSQLDFDPLGKPTGVDTYTYCRITAAYTTDQLDTGADPKYSYDFGGEALQTVEGRTWDSDGKPCDIPLSTFYPLISFSLTFVTLAWDTTTVFNAIGKVNSALWLGAPAGYVLLEGVNAENEYQPDGTTRWRITYRFLYRQRSHNEVYRPPKYVTDSWGRPTLDAAGHKTILTAGKWDTPLDASSDPLYESTDFSVLVPGT